MKILYSTSLSLDNKMGAQQHVMEIFSRFNKDGAEIQLLSPPYFDTGITSAIKRKFILADLMNKKIKSFSPDIVYFRYEGADVLSIREVVKHKIPYILELNTKTVPEFWTTRRFLPLAISLVSEPYVFRNASGIAAMTPEIYQYAVKLSKKQTPFLLAKNGVCLDSFNYHGYNPSLRKKHDTPLDAPLLAMIGSIAPWHGIDLVLESLARSELNNFYLWLIGNVGLSAFKEKFNPRVMERVRVIPWQEPKELSQTLSAADIGIGALALYRNHMREAQSLKSRVYLASGLPTLLGYNDLVISHKLPFISPGIYSTIEELASEIKRFYDFVKSDRDGLGKQAREFTENNLSWDIAAKETLEFIKFIYATHN